MERNAPRRVQLAITAGTDPASDRTLSHTRAPVESVALSALFERGGQFALEGESVVLAVVPIATSHDELS